MMNIENMTVFTTALCNLNCKYCYICKDKKGGLQKIDELLEKDLKECKNIDVVLDYDNSIKDTLTSITLWGGEPFLHMERFTENMDQYFAAFPNLNNFNLSTNFTVDDQFEATTELLKGIDKYYHGSKTFTFDYQISIDGYTEMNDSGRGDGVTERFLRNFNKFLDLKYNTNKINLHLSTKPTLSQSTFEFLSTKEKCYKWFKFFNDEMFIPYVEHKPSWGLNLNIFNCATPVEWVKEDGIKYAAIVKNIIDAKEEIKQLPAWVGNQFTVYPLNNIVELFHHCQIKSYDEYKNIVKTQCGGSSCGVFTCGIVPISDGKFTMCHRGLFDSFVEYTNHVKNMESMHGLSQRYYKNDNVEDWTYTKEDLKCLQNTMNQYYCPHNINYIDLMYSIRDFAEAGIIDPKYANSEEIIPTLGAFLGLTYCVQDAYIMNGSWTTQSMLEVPLLYNGAMDEVMKELHSIMKEKGYML